MTIAHPNDRRPLPILGQELDEAFRGREARLRYRIHRGRVEFDPEVAREHQRLRTRLLSYVRGARLSVILTAPVIYLGMIPFLALDLFVTLFQAICFPIYRIPQVRRADYVIFDRGNLSYLNGIERLNCRYCSYANGLLAYAVAVAGRTEQHWCPIKHAHRIQAPHKRYAHFLEYGNAVQYRANGEAVSEDFSDLAASTPDQG